MQLEALFRPKSKPMRSREAISLRPIVGLSDAPTTAIGIAELPEAPDVALFCVGHARVLDAYLAAAERGVKGAVIYDGGFAERGEEGRKLQTQIVGIRRDAGIALCGPNCM